MLLLTATTDKFQLITSAAVNVDVHASYVDLSGATVTPGRQNTAITTATTTDIVASPGASTTRNVQTLTVRNKGAANVDVTVVFDQNGTDYELHKATLMPGEMLEFLDGLGFVKISGGFASRAWSVAAQTPFSSDTYLTGSYLKFPVAPAVGTLYQMWFDITKTAAGTATPIINIRVGTAGTTGDTARNTFTFGAGTAAADAVQLLVWASFRTVGSGTSAVLQGTAAAMKNLTTTGWSNAVSVRVATSAGFDSTVASLGVGVSYNGGASAAHTVQLVRSELITG